jgi:hypothetical protein
MPKKNNGNKVTKELKVDGQIDLIAKCIRLRSEYHNDLNAIAHPYILFFSTTMLSISIFLLVKYYHSDGGVSREDLLDLFHDKFYGYDASKSIRENIINGFMDDIHKYKDLVSGIYQTREKYIAATPHDDWFKLGDIPEKYRDNPEYAPLMNFSQAIDFFVSTANIKMKMVVKSSNDMALVPLNKDMLKLHFKFVAPFYELFIRQSSDIFSMMPSAFKVSSFKVSSKSLPAKFFDFNNRMLRYDLLNQLPTFIEMAALIISFILFLEQLDAVVDDSFESMSTVVAKQLNSIGDMLISKYAMLFAIALSAFLHHMLTAPILSQLFRYINDGITATVSSVDYMSPSALKVLCCSLEKKRSELAPRVSRSQKYSFNASCALFLLGVGAFCQYSEYAAIRPLIAYFFGSVASKSLGFVWSSFNKGSLNKDLESNEHHLRALFKDMPIKISRFKGTSKKDSCYLLESSCQDDLYLVESFLGQFGAHVYSPQSDKGKVLVAADYDFSAIKKESLDSLRAKVRNIRLVKEQFVNSFSYGSVPSHCRVHFDIAYDDRHDPVFHFVIRGVNQISSIDAAVSNGFKHLGNGVLVYQTDEKIKDVNVIKDPIGYMKELREHDESLMHQHMNSQIAPSVSGAASRRRYIASQRKVVDDVNVDHAHQGHMWHFDGADISSGDAAVTRLNGCSYEAYCLFRLDQSYKAEQSSSYQRFFEQSGKIAKSAMGSQGIKFYPKGCLPNGAIGRVKLLGSEGDTSLPVYRAPNTQPPLYYTGENLQYRLH